MARLKPYGRKSADLIMGSTQGYIRTQVEPRKKVRFAENLTSDQDRPTKKVKSTQASIHQTIEGRVGKSYGGAKISAKDERVRRAKALRGFEKILDEYSGYDGDSNVDANEEDSSDEENRRSPSPSRGLEDESEDQSEGESQGEPEVPDESGESEGPDEHPQYRWKYHGPGRWTRITEDEEEAAADANADSPTARTYLVIVHHDGEDFKFEINGNALEEMSPFFRAARSGRWTARDVATIVDDDVDHFTSYLLATFHWKKFRRDVHDAISASKPHPVEGDDVPEQVRQAREETFETLIGAYIVADKYGDIYRANQMIDQIIRFSRATMLLPHLKTINQAYDSTLQSNPLRAVIRDLFIHEARLDALEVVVRHDDVHANFAADVALEWCKLKFDHMNGHINKWFKQEVASRPKGHYHQELRELTPQARGVILTGTYQQILQAIDTTKPDEEDGESDSSDEEEVSKASEALLEAIGE